MKINVSRETICLKITIKCPRVLFLTHGGTAQGPFPTHDYSAIRLMGNRLFPVLFSN